MYSNNSPVNGTFYYSNDLSENIDIYLTKTYPAELTDIVSEIVDGNTTPFRNLVNRSIKKFLNQSVSEPINFGPLSTGDYVVIIMLNETNSNNLTIASATTFQVLEYSLTTSSPDSVLSGSNYDIQVSLSAANANYTYGTFLIREDAYYKSNLKLRSNGTIAGTNLSAEGIPLVDAFKIAGIGLNKVNRSTIQKIVGEIIGSNNGTVLLKTTGNSTNLSLITDDLDPGKYILSIGAWSNRPGERLVGFFQKEVVVYPGGSSNEGSGSSGGGSGGGVTTSEPFDNIEKYETVYGHFRANQSVKYSFNPGESGIYELFITGKENEDDIAIRIEHLKGLSRLVTEQVPGEVKYYVNIWAGSKKIKEAEIEFKVENSWIASNGLASSDVKIYKWDGSKWLQLGTLEKTNDASYTYFEAKTDTFSHFAISGINIAVPTATPVATVNPKTEITPEISPEITPASAPLTVPSTGQPATMNLNWNWIIYVLVAIMIIATVYFIIKKREDKK
jgi:methanogen extracellular protein (TIGR04279 family)/PGF-pre-PGF domain-containing protein